MKSPLAQSTVKSAKSLAQDIAKQMAQEPWEMLKRVPGEITGSRESIPNNPSFSSSSSDSQQEAREQQIKEANNIKTGRRMEALDRELKDISRERTFKELQRKISEGQEVYLEEFPELSMEQKQVLNAQKEAVQAQIAQQQDAQNNGLIEPGAKKGRRLMGFGKKTQVQKQQTRVEKPMSPSG